jgi:hypothetical protein
MEPRYAATINLLRTPCLERVRGRVRLSISLTVLRRVINEVVGQGGEEDVE